MIYDCVIVNVFRGILEKDVYIVILEDSRNLKDRFFVGNVNYKLDIVIVL